MGQALFASRALSADGQVACNTCHRPEHAFADTMAVSDGVLGRHGLRNAPTLLDALRQKTLFWEGRADTPQAQIAGPLFDVDEMGLADEADLAKRVRDNAALHRASIKVFGHAATAADVISALVAYECTLTTQDSPFDKYTRGDNDAISVQAKRGWDLFNTTAQCSKCHGGKPDPGLFSDGQYHNIGIGLDAEGFVQPQARASHLGRFVVTHDSRDVGAFRTPMLRNVGITAPYMHDGSLATLYDVMDHYNRGGDLNPHLDGDMHRLNLSEDDIDALVAFMFTLTDVRYSALNQLERTHQDARKHVRPERLQAPTGQP